MQHTDSHLHTGQKPVAFAIATPRQTLRDVWAKCARRAAAVAVAAAAAAFATPFNAQAQGFLNVDAPATPAAADPILSLGPLRLDVPTVVQSMRQPFSTHSYLGDMFSQAKAPGPVYAAMQLRIDAPPWQTDPRFAELVLDANTGEIVYERNGLAARHLASMNKVMTAYLVFAALADGTLTPETLLMASAQATGQGGMSMNLRRGQQVTVEQALDQLITVSANDAAVLLAEAIAGSEAAFAARMTETARRMGAAQTTFASASGRFGDDSTAYDMALIFRQVGNDYPEFYQRYFTNNCSWCETTAIHATGRKTGTRSVAGYNVVVRVEHAGRDYILVSMGARDNPGRFGRAIDLAQAVWGDPAPSPFGQETSTALAKAPTTTAVSYTGSAAAWRPSS